MDQNLYDSLTSMERNCLRLARHDRKSEQIGHELGIAASTVNTHIFAARRKMGGVSRLSAADQLRRFEETLDSGHDGDVTPPAAPPVSSPQRVSKQHLWIGGTATSETVVDLPTEVREQRAAFVFDDEVQWSGRQEPSGEDALVRLRMLLVIAALVALVLIAAPAIYDSAAQRIANSLERPHRS